MTDTELLEWFKSGSSGAGELLYRSYFPSVADYVMTHNGTREDAEDIFQEALVVLLQKVRTTDFVLTSSLKTFLYAVARNLWLKQLRDHPRKTMADEYALLAVAETDVQPFDIIPPKPRSVQVLHWLEKITANCKHILQAIFFYKEPMQQLLIRMGWKNKHTAHNQQYKCLQQIRKVAAED